METRDVWSCTVKVLWKESEEPAVIYELKSQEEIPETISKAQTEILRIETLKAKKKIEVSKSVVEVSISGPNYFDLTLIDLPGIVRTVGMPSFYCYLPLFQRFEKEKMKAPI